jgi:biofilm PGA synthesis N-glycosyltransferase PgaC
LTDDVELTWRLQLAGWSVVIEPKAMCWILMPETLKGLWRQRLRWSEGGTQTMLISIPKLLSAPLHYWRGWIVCLNYVLSIVWAYLMCLRPVAMLLGAIRLPMLPFIPVSRLVPEWFGLALTLTYLAQAVVSVAIDNRFERKIGRALFWVVWYPLLFWMLQALTAVVGLPKAIRRMHHPTGTWVSPDRGVA